MGEMRNGGIKRLDGERGNMKRWFPSQTSRYVQKCRSMSVFCLILVVEMGDSGRNFTSVGHKLVHAADALLGSY